MKNLTQLLLIFLTCSSFAQNIWEPINVPDTIYPTTINAENENFLFTTSMGMSGDNYIIRSNDDGLTWEKINLTVPYFIPIYTIRFHSSGALFIGTLNSIYKSLDNGNTFEEVYSNYSFVPAFEIDFSPNGEIYAIGNSIILRSIDIGENWDTLYHNNSLLYFVDIGFGVNGEIYTIGIDHYTNDDEGFFRSLDNGSTWENIGITDKELHSLNVNSNGTILVSGSGTGGVFSSSDLGSNWTQISDMEVDVMESFSNDKLIGGRFINNPTGCWLSNNWGHDWESLVDSVLKPSVSHISVSPSGHIYVQSNLTSNSSNQIFKSLSPLYSNDYSLISTEIKLYPNPTSGILAVETNKYSKENQYKIYNQTGELVLSGKVIDNNINTSELSSGLHIIEFEIEHKFVRMKIIIK